MIIRTRKPSDIPSSEITPESTWINRRTFLGASAGIGAASFLGMNGLGMTGLGATGARHDPATGAPVPQELEPNTLEEITSYNNFYEFGTGKSDPSKRSHTLVTAPWTIRVDGLCNNPGEFQLEDFIKPSTIEDRVYRFRCVEAWAMVIPWRGFPLADVGGGGVGDRRYRPCLPSPGLNQLYPPHHGHVHVHAPEVWSRPRPLEMLSLLPRGTGHVHSGSQKPTP